MTCAELAKILMRTPDDPVCVAHAGVVREVEVVRLAEQMRYLPPDYDALVAFGRCALIEAGSV